MLSSSSSRSMSTFSSATGDSPNSSNECEEDVDPPQLSADTMAALLEFYSEKEAMLVEPPLTAPAFTEIWVKFKDTLH